MSGAAWSTEAPSRQSALALCSGPASILSFRFSSPVLPGVPVAAAPRVVRAERAQRRLNIAEPLRHDSVDQILSCLEPTASLPVPVP